jgi:hypothetical protein
MKEDEKDKKWRMGGQTKWRGAVNECNPKRTYRLCKKNLS